MERHCQFVIRSRCCRRKRYHIFSFSIGINCSSVQLVRRVLHPVSMQRSELNIHFHQRTERSQLNYVLNIWPLDQSHNPYSTIFRCCICGWSLYNLSYDYSSTNMGKTILISRCYLFNGYSQLKILLKPFETIILNGLELRSLLLLLYLFRITIFNLRKTNCRATLFKSLDIL